MNVPWLNNLNIIYISCRKNNSSINWGLGREKKKGNEERRKRKRKEG